MLLHLAFSSFNGSLAVEPAKYTHLQLETEIDNYAV